MVKKLKVKIIISNRLCRVAAEGHTAKHVFAVFQIMAHVK
jgi:hypothetical protein